MLDAKALEASRAAYQSAIPDGAWHANGGETDAPIRAAITAYIQAVGPEPAVAEQIADAVLDWMVKYDLLDAGNEYGPAEVLAVLNDLAPSERSALVATPPAEPDFAASIAETITEECAAGAACGWRSCTGCHETNEGAETGHYPYSKMFGCHVGSGCSECGGLGVVWEHWSEDSLNEMAADVSAPTPPADSGAPPCWWIDHGSHGQITQREDEASRAIAEGKRVVRYTASIATPPAERAVEALLDERQKRAEQVYDRILAARDGIRVNLSPDSPEWLRDAFNKLHEAHHIMGGDPFDMHMRAALAAKPAVKDDETVVEALPNWNGWRSIDTAPEDCRVILATAGGWVGEAIMLRDEDTGEQVWTWVDTGKPSLHSCYGWMPLPAPLVAPVLSDLRPDGFDGPTGAE